MNLHEQIQKAQIRARIIKDIISTDLYTSLLGELSTQAKNKQVSFLGDADVVAVVKKFLKSVNETLGHLQQKLGVSEDEKSVNYFSDKICICQKEIELLSQFLPKQLNENDLKFIFTEAIDKGNATPTVQSLMTYLKSSYTGQYDGKLASDTAKAFCNV